MTAREKEADVNHNGSPVASFVVLSIFKSAPELRQRFLNLIEEFAAGQARVQPGLCGFELFTDESAEQIITLARWKDRASFETFKTSDAGKQATEVGRTLLPTIYFLHPEGALAQQQAPARVLVEP